MLPKKNRLNLKYEFQKMRTQGNKMRIGPVTLFTTHNTQQESPSAAVIVPATVTKIKPVRNKIKRLLFENYRKNTARFPQTLKAVFMVYEDVTQWDHSHIEYLYKKINKYLEEQTSQTK